MSYDNEMRGVLFRNEDKKSPKHPDYKGNAQVDGVEYWLAGWVNKSKAGKQYLSIRFEPKEEKYQGSSGPAAYSSVEDDIPF